MTYRATLGFLVVSLVSGACDSSASHQDSEWAAQIGAGRDASLDGRYDEAEQHFQAALEEAERLWQGDARLEETLSSLGNVYDILGRHERAEPLYQRLLAAAEQRLGGEHPEIALSLNELARHYERQGKYEQAEGLYRRALAVREKALGPDHVQVAASLYDLADLYTEQGRYTQAEPLLLRGLAIREKALGPDDFALSFTLEDYARLLRALDREDEAATVEARAKAIRTLHESVPDE